MNYLMTIGFLLSSIFCSQKSSSNAFQQLHSLPRRKTGAAAPEEEATRRVQLQHMPPGQDRLRALAGPGKDRRELGSGSAIAAIVDQRGHEAERGAGVQGHSLGPEEGGGKDRLGPARPHL